MIIGADHSHIPFELFLLWNVRFIVAGQQIALWFRVALFSAIVTSRFWTPLGCIFISGSLIALTFCMPRFVTIKAHNSEFVIGSRLGPPLSPGSRASVWRSVSTIGTMISHMLVLFAATCRANKRYRISVYFYEWFIRSGFFEGISKLFQVVCRWWLFVFDIGTEFIITAVQNSFL